MPDKVKLLSERELKEIEHLDPEGDVCELVALARWAAKAHAWLQSARRELTHLDTCQVWSDEKDDTVCDCDLTALLDEIDTPETPND